MSDDFKDISSCVEIHRIGQIPLSQTLDYFYYGNVRPANAAMGTIFFNTDQNQIDILTIKGWVRIYG